MLLAIVAEALVGPVTDKAVRVPVVVMNKDLCGFFEEDGIYRSLFELDEGTEPAWQ